MVAESRVVEATAPSTSANPHTPQNREPASVSAPQFGQPAASAAPHQEQNL